MPRTKLDIPNLPASITAERDGEIGFLRLSRPEKRNALNDTLVFGIEAYFAGAAGRTSARWSCSGEATISRRVSICPN